MPKQGVRESAEEIVFAIRKIEIVTAGLNEEIFCDDFRIHDVVLMNLVVIAESVKQFPDEVRLVHSEVEWYRIIGLRNVISHTYADVDLPTIWNIVSHHLPVLESTCRKIILNQPHR